MVARYFLKKNNKSESSRKFIKIAIVNLIKIFIFAASLQKTILKSNFIYSSYVKIE